MALIHLQDTPRAAFVRGLWKGIAAPLMLYSSFTIPAAAEPLEFKPLQRKWADPGQDWMRVGGALREAADRISDESRKATPSNRNIDRSAKADRGHAQRSAAKP